MNQEFDYQSLIPPHWKIRVRNESDLINLGRGNLTYLMQYWELKQKKSTQQIKATRKRQDAVTKTTISDIKKLARTYEHPAFPDIEVGGKYGPEPSDDDSANRKPGATTFNFCGWCEYCLSGIINCRANINSTCGLLPESFRDAAGNEVINSRLYFNTPCLITEYGTDELLKACSLRLKARIKEALNEKFFIDNKIDYITIALTKSEEKPHFAGYRPRSWLNVGDLVVCFVSKNYNCGKTIKDNVFVRGTVIEKISGSDAHVLVQMSTAIYTDNFGYSKDVASYRVNAPEIMSEWEFEYLKSNPDYLRVWMAGSAFSPRFGFDDF